MTTQPQHAPGPWMYYGPRDGVVTISNSPESPLDSQVICTVPMPGVPGDDSFNRACKDIRLIAAAPDLLDLAQFVQATLEEVGRRLDPGEQVLLDKANAAITKATDQ